jgi:F0F1-type ATP synthase membrane subunit c/vacuolar-type H+-ATPase subunit K
MKKFNLLLIAFLVTFSLPIFANTNTLIEALSVSNQIMLFAAFAVIGVGILSSGYALSISLSAYAACDKDNRGTAFIPAVMPGSQGLYSFAISFLMIQNLIDKPLQVSFAGLICGLPCLFSAIGQAKTAAACIKSINNGQMDQGQALLATGVPELYALTGLAGAFLVMFMI